MRRECNISLRRSNNQLAFVLRIDYGGIRLVFGKKGQKKVTLHSTLSSLSEPGERARRERFGRFSPLPPSFRL